MSSNNRLGTIWCQLAGSTRYQSYVEEQDLQSFLRRSESEGPEFFARGLTSLRQSLLSGLQTRRLTVEGRFGLKRGTSLPRFLFRAWHSIFDEVGCLREEYDACAVSCLNQLLAVFGKIEGGHTPESETRVIEQFLHAEEEVRTFVPNTEMFGRRCFKGILTRARHMIARVLAGSDPRDILPRHGSGASACGTPVWARYGKARYIEEIDRIWSYSEYYFLGPSHLSDSLEGLMRSEAYVPRAKVLLVPKDAKGPRLISCEPRETMWIQQGLMQKLYDCIERHPMTRGSVMFTDQRENQKAARLGSVDDSLATLDLKEASDRVSMLLVEWLFPVNWVTALHGARSKSTVLPDGRVVELHKHAPMGSAVCFPVMAMCIWAVLAATLAPGSKILVYGDDIVCEAAQADLAIAALERVGLKVNVNKSFVKGPFRESCGKEYIDGVDITPIRLRSYPADDNRSRARTIAFANNLFAKFGSEACWMHSLVRKWYGGVPERTCSPNAPTPVAHCDLRSLRITTELVTDHAFSNVLNVPRADNKHLPRRWNPRYQVWEFRYLVAVPRKFKYPKDAWCSLFRAIVTESTDPLGTDALPKRIAYKYRWAPLA